VAISYSTLFILNFTQNNFQRTKLSKAGLQQIDTNKSCEIQPILRVILRQNQTD
jgi:hypothetical protein